MIANASDTRWGIPSIFRGGDTRAVTKDNLLNKPFSEAVEDMSQNLSMIYLKEVCFLCRRRWIILICATYSTHTVCFAFLKPPAVLRPSETHSEQEAVEIQITKLLLKSYYDIVRKNIEDSVPKAIMHFLASTLISSMFLAVSQTLTIYQHLDIWFFFLTSLVERVTMKSI